MITVEFFEPFRVMTMICAGVMVAIALASIKAWRRWSRSKRVLAWAVSMLMISNGYAAFEASMAGTSGGPRSVLVTTCMIIGLIGVIIAVRDDSKDAGDRGR